MSLGVLLTDAAVPFGKTGFIGPADGVDDGLDRFPLAGLNLFDGRLVEKIPIA